MTDAEDRPTRDNAGRFLRGNPGGPGNPQLIRFQHWQESLHRVVTPKRLDKIVKKLCELAEGGNVYAAREVLNRCMGKPKETIDATIQADVRTLAPWIQTMLGVRNDANQDQSDTFT